MAEAAVLQQWQPECDDCDNTTEHICKTCGDKLCTDCKKQHLSRKKNRDHKVVPYSEGIKLLQKSNSKCQKHPAEKYQLYCSPCQMPVCTPCVSEFHGTKDHEFISIVDAFSTAKTKATGFLSRLRSHVRPSIKGVSEEANKSSEKVTKTVDSLEQEMKGRAKQLHDEVDLVLKDNLNELQQMKEKRLMPEVLHQQKEINDLQDQLDAVERDYESNLRSDDPIDLILFMKERQSDNPDQMFPVPKFKEISLPTFTSKPVSRKIIENEFGLLCTNLQIVDNPDVRKESCFADSMKDDLNKIRCQGSDKLWIACAGKIYLANYSGKILRTVEVDYKTAFDTGMYVTEEGELIFTDYENRKLHRITRDFEVTTLLKTREDKPRGLARLENGDWVVCLWENKLVRVFSDTGTIVKDIGKGELSSPIFVSVNKVISSICVSDNYSKVVVFSYSGEKRFTYTGNSSSDTKFDPHDLCCDQLGNILITDYKNHRVHIIDRNGHFVKYLVLGKESVSNPITIDIDSRGNAVVGEMKSKKVKSFVYLR